MAYAGGGGVKGGWAVKPMLLTSLHLLGWVVLYVILWLMISDVD